MLASIFERKAGEKFLREAVRFQDVVTVRRLLDKRCFELPFANVTLSGVLDADSILMVRHTGKEDKKSHAAAREFFESHGPDVAAIAELFDKGRVKFEQTSFKSA